MKHLSYISEINPDNAKKLVGKVVAIKHIKSGLEMHIEVLDYSSDNNGFIGKVEATRELVSAFHKNWFSDVKTANIYKEYTCIFISLDLRDNYDGDKFIILFYN